MTCSTGSCVLLLALLTNVPAQQHGGQFFFPQQQQPQQQRFFPQVGNLRPSPEPTPARNNFGQRGYQQDQDPNTSDLVRDQFSYQSPFAQFSNFPQVSTPSPNEPYSFQDQRFGHFQGLIQQPVSQNTIRPQVLFGFNSQFDQQRRPQLQQPTAAPPRQIQLAARFPTPVQTVQQFQPSYEEFRSQEVFQGTRQNTNAVRTQQSTPVRAPVQRKPTSQVQTSFGSVRESESYEQSEELQPARVKPVDRGRVRATTESDISDYDAQTFRGNRVPTRTRTSTTRREKPLPTVASEPVTRRPDGRRVEVRRRPVQPLPFVDPLEPEVTYERHEKTVVTTSNSYVRSSPTTPVPKFTNFVTQRAQHRLRVPFENEIVAPGRTTSTTTTTPKPTTPVTRAPELQSEETHRGVYPSKEEEEEEEVEYEYSTEDESAEEVEGEAVAPTTTPVAGQMGAPDRAGPETTESWVVVASVQTSRSVSGARFLPAGIVSQKVWNDTLGPDGLPMVNASTLPPSSTESIIDKLDQVQSELSSGIFSGGFRNAQLAVLPAMPMAEKEVEPSEAAPSTSSTTTSTTTTTTTSTTTTTAAPSTSTTEESLNDDGDDEEQAFVRKFSPAAKRTTPKPKKSSLLDNLQFDDLAGLLPAGFKPRNSKKPSSTSPRPDVKTDSPPAPKRVVPTNSFKPKQPKKKLESNIVFQEDIGSLLPPGYKPSPENKTESKLPVESLLSKIKFEEVSSLLPAGYKPQPETTQKPEKPSLLAGLKFETPKGLLPPGFKPQVESKSEAKPVSEILSKVNFETPVGLLPPGFKPSEADEKPVSSILSKVKFETPAGLLPLGFKPSEKQETTTAPVSKPTTAASKIVLFPGGKGPASRKPFGRQTTEKAPAENAPEVPKIQKGWPVRATTVFTGWPTPPTTPISVEKLLEIARLATSTSSPATDSTTTETSTTTTTTTTTTPRPTTPGLCRDGCELAGTVKLVGGAQWQPELLDPRTTEWQQLANEVTDQLDEIYRNSAALSSFYKAVRIESFSKGSVLVDYFVELEDKGQPLSTTQIRTLFHQSLSEVNLPTSDDVTSTKLLKLGRYIIDPQGTDFIVVEPAAVPSSGIQDEDSFLPQWAIAVIVIGLASLLFVIIFGVTVMVSRHKNNRTRNPTPLTEDIIKEMNKHHLGPAMSHGLDNYGADDLYGMDNVWNEKPYERPHKKRSHGSFADNSMTNLYDSWRSDWHGYERSYSHYPPSHFQQSQHSQRPAPDYDTNF